MVTTHLHLERMPRALIHTAPATTGLTEVEYAIPVANLGEEYGGFDGQGHVVVSAKRGWLVGSDWDIVRIQVFAGTDGQVEFDDSQRIADLDLAQPAATNALL